MLSAAKVHEAVLSAAKVHEAVLSAPVIHEVVLSAAVVHEVVFSAAVVHEAVLSAAIRHHSCKKFIFTKDIFVDGENATYSESRLNAYWHERFGIATPAIAAML